MASALPRSTKSSGGALSVARTLLVWTSRPAEIANLLNPAFASLLIRSAAHGYTRDDPSGLPLTLAYLLLPIVLHRKTRESLPRTTKTRVHTWLQANQHILAGFAERASQMVPYTREALLFGAQQSIFVLNASARLDVTTVRLRSVQRAESLEVGECLSRAELLGRLFARAGDSATILAMWGVRP